MNEPVNPLGREVWQRGARLGLIWLAGFTILAVGLYGLLGVLGWSGTLRALCAMGVGPVLGCIGIAVWWIARRPNLAEPPSDRPGGGSL